MNNFQKEILFDSRKKSKLVAYLLGAVLGSFGCHRFYLGEYKGGVAYLILLLLMLVVPAVSFFHLVFLIVDFFLTYGLVKDYNANVRREIEAISEE